MVPLVVAVAGAPLAITTQVEANRIIMQLAEVETKVLVPPWALVTSPLQFTVQRLAMTAACLVSPNAPTPTTAVAALEAGTTATTGSRSPTIIGGCSSRLGMTRLIRSGRILRRLVSCC